MASFNDTLTLSDDVRLGMGNCAVVATSIFCNVPYSVVEQGYREIVKSGVWRKDSGKSWGNPSKPKSFGLYDDEIRAGLRKFNKRRSVTFKFAGTLNQFVRSGAKHGVRYLVVTTRHAQTLQNGVVVDQGVARPIEEFWGKGKQVRFIVALK